MICLLLLAAGFFYRDSLQQIFGGIREISAEGFCISILLSAAAYVLEGACISCIAGAAAFMLPVQKGIAIALICEFYRMITLGGGPGFAEIHYLHKDGMEPGSAAVMTMIQYMVKRTSVMLLGILGFCVLYAGGNESGICREYAAFMGIGCVVTMGVILVFMGLTLSSRAAAWAGKRLDWMGRKIPSWKRRFLGWKEQVELLSHSGKAIVRQKGRLLCAILLQTGKMLLFYGIPAILLRGKTGLSLAENTLLMAVAYMLAGVIPAPSGAGALEFVFLLFFSRFTDAGMALPAVLLFRFVTWILPFGVGGCVLLFIHPCLVKKTAVPYNGLQKKLRRGTSENTDADGKAEKGRFLTEMEEYMDIRRAKEKDMDRINELLRQVCLVHHNGRPDLFKGDGSRKYTDDQLLEIIHDDRRPVFVAVDEAGCVLGYAFCIFQQHKNDNILTDIKTLYIDDLCVDEHIRGRHIGRALYESVLAFAKEEGCYNVTLNVWSCNEAAVKFYENCGLKPQKVGMETIL